MPVYVQKHGERLRSSSEDARYIECHERDLFRNLLSVESDARTLIEMAECVKKDGGEFTLDSDKRRAIADATAALMELNSILPMPNLRGAA